MSNLKLSAQPISHSRALALFDQIHRGEGAKILFGKSTPASDKGVFGKIAVVSSLLRPEYIKIAAKKAMGMLGWIHRGEGAKIPFGKSTPASDEEVFGRIAIVSSLLRQGHIENAAKKAADMKLTEEQMLPELAELAAAYTHGGMAILATDCKIPEPGTATGSFKSDKVG